MLPFKTLPSSLPPSPTPDILTHPHVHTRCSERGICTLVLKDTLPIPLYFRLANTLSWLWCLDIPPFSCMCSSSVQWWKQHAMFSLQNRNAVQTLSPPRPHPFPSQIQKCFPLLKNCIPIQHWSKAWLCSMMNAQFPVHKQNYGKWEAFLASKETRAAVSDLIFFV